MASTALVVLVPEAEPVVAGVRARHDASVRIQVPAYLRYGGRHADIIPHLTVAQGSVSCFAR